MNRSRSLIPFSIPFLLSACASAGGEFEPLGPEHPASPDAPEVAIADPSALLRAREPVFATPVPAAAGEPAAQASGAYVCPMHAEVASDQPGRCPKCGMQLAARDAGASEEHRHDG